MKIKTQNFILNITQKGAEPTSLKFKNLELIWQGKKDFWSGKAPILFPICGFLKDGYYLHQDKKYKMPVHGFVSAKEFAVEKYSDSEVTLSLQGDSETLKQYPFDFKLTVGYALSENELTVKFSIENTSREKELPCSLGWHPGFNINNGSYLQFSKDKFLRRAVTKEGLIGESGDFHVKNGKLDLNEKTFANGGIVLEGFNAELALVNEGYRINFETGDFPNLVLWGQPGSDFVCVEPWYGMGDTQNHTHIFSDKENLMNLLPGQKKQLTLPIRING